MFQIQTYWYLSISILPPQYPYKQFGILKENYFDGFGACYGVWSKYVPLSNIVQTGEQGIDSICFHLYRIQEQIENHLYFLFFVCISFEEKIIKKYFQFLDSDYKFQLILYEGVWYFNGFMASPSEKRVNIFIKEQQQNQIFSKDIEIRIPFKELNFIQIIGGNFKVEQTSKFYLLENQILSHFPGQINYLRDCSYKIPNYFFQQIQSKNQKQCYCKNNQIFTRHQNLKFRHLQIFILKYQLLIISVSLIDKNFRDKQHFQ